MPVALDILGVAAAGGQRRPKHTDGTFPPGGVLAVPPHITVLPEMADTLLRGPGTTSDSSWLRLNVAHPLLRNDLFPSPAGTVELVPPVFEAAPYQEMLTTVRPLRDGGVVGVGDVERA